MALLVKYLLPSLKNDLHLIPRTHVLEGEYNSEGCPLISSVCVDPRGHARVCAPSFSSMCAQAQTHTNTT